MIHTFFVFLINPHSFTKEKNNGYMNTVVRPMNSPQTQCLFPSVKEYSSRK